MKRLAKKKNRKGSKDNSKNRESDDEVTKKLNEVYERNDSRLPKELLIAQLSILPDEKW
jgi:hypothetical protein